MSEVYFCGKCDRQQQTREGIPCKICGKSTVSWFTNKETAQDAKRKWKHINS